jgi:hypothetical protein
MKELSAFKHINLLKCCDIGSRMTNFGLPSVNSLCTYVTQYLPLNFVTTILWHTLVTCCIWTFLVQQNIILPSLSTLCVWPSAGLHEGGLTECDRVGWSAFVIPNLVCLRSGASLAWLTVMRSLRLAQNSVTVNPLKSDCCSEGMEK